MVSPSLFAANFLFVIALLITAWNQIGFVLLVGLKTLNHYILFQQFYLNYSKILFTHPFANFAK